MTGGGVADTKYRYPMTIGDKISKLFTGRGKTERISIPKAIGGNAEINSNSKNQVINVTAQTVHIHHH